jgi:hypothetical protein
MSTNGRPHAFVRSPRASHRALAGIARGDVGIFIREGDVGGQLFIQFISITAEFALSPGEGIPSGPRDHTKVCDGKTSARLA